MELLIPVLFILFGISVCIYGYSRWKGKIHWSYFAQGYLMREINYIAIPLGTTATILGFAILPSVPSQIQSILIGIGFLIMLISFFASWYLFKPDWVRWIEENHKDVIPYLQMEVRDKGWHGTTQEELETWINELRVKYRPNLE